jgi:hypothetical protein
MTDTFILAEDELRRCNSHKAAEIIYEYKTHLAACCEMIKDDRVKLFKELMPWSKKLFLCYSIFDMGLTYLIEPTDELKNTISAMLYEYNRIPEVLTEFSFRSTIELLINK